MGERTDWDAIGEGHAFGAWERGDLSIELFEPWHPVGSLSKESCWTPAELVERMKELV